jgi:ATP-dependent Clp protease ATP-binding subunit ClpA
MGSGRFDFTELLASTATDYIGRELVEAEIKDDVDRRAHGVCVVIGEPGSGKTALAVAAVRRHDDRLPSPPSSSVRQRPKISATS